MLLFNADQLRRIESILNSEVDAIHSLILEEEPEKPDYQIRMAKLVGGRNALRQLLSEYRKKLGKEDL